MKIICKNCKKEIEAGSSFCTYCGIKTGVANNNITVSHKNNRRKIRTFFIYLGAFAVFIILIIFLNANLLFPWQNEARKNKRAALEYVSENYSDAKFIKAHYGTTKINFGSNGYDRFVFDLNGVRFSIFAERGEITIDSYWSSFAEHQLYNTYIKPFAEPRKITASFSYNSNQLLDYFKNNPEANISQFDGGVDIMIYDGECTNPKSLGWLYDFYSYCRGNIPFGYTVTIICQNSSLTFSKECRFKNETEFYNSFS